jgi:3-oxoacyl-[acyl-carrier protein] reductase
MTSGQVALVTGAGRGIGRQIAIRLAQDGFRLCLAARSGSELAATAEKVRSAGISVECVTGDVARSEDVARICDTVEQRLGPVDLLVNNAAFFGNPGPFLDTDIEQWWRVLETNLLGPALLDRRILPGMLDRRRGRVITINSRAAVHIGDPAVTSSAYSVSKAAVLRFDSSLARELAGSGVAVFSLNPGLVRTSMSEQRPDFADIPDGAFLPPSAAADIVAALGSGRYDQLHGRLLHATDDLDALLEAVNREPGVRTLTVIPAATDDALLGK